MSFSPTVSQTFDYLGVCIWKFIQKTLALVVWPSPLVPFLAAYSLKKIVIDDSAALKHQKKLFVVSLVAGISAIATGYFTLKQPTGLVSVLPPERSFEEILKEAATCSVQRFQGMMDEYPADSRMGELANTVQSCMKIDCDNFLPWDPKFHLGRTGYVDGIPPVALGNTSIRWFIDQFQRPGIAFKYLCNGTYEGAAAIFKLYNDVVTDQYNLKDDSVVLGGYYQPTGCSFAVGNASPTLSALREMCHRGWTILTSPSGSSNITFS